MTTQAKVTIPREVADAVENLRKGDESSAFTNEDIAYKYSTISDRSVSALSIRKIPFDTLMRALLDGYERELTEEEAREEAYEKLRQVYAEHRSGEGAYETSREDRIFSDGIKCALNTLGIVISEINSEANNAEKGGAA
ncbi:hypothetical protein [Paenibacillus sp. FSL K6-2859]|uniref:hypothetical protein n=1 Tax=Paenibacillus sp. FSL K6-2859 TaxID=2921482 RepID=UPI0030F56868